MKQTSNKRKAKLAPQSAKRFAAFVLCTLSLAACSEQSEFDNNSTATISGSATVAASGSGEITKSATPAAGVLSELMFHYTAKGTAEIWTRKVENTSGSHTAIAFNTAEYFGEKALYWQGIEAGTTTAPQALYLTAMRESGDCFDAAGKAVLEPLWATSTSTGTRESVDFKEMQARTAKFTVALTATQGIDPALLSVYMGVKPIASPPADITTLAIPAGATVATTPLIHAASASAAKQTAFTGSTLIAAQPLTNAENAITVWYDKNKDKKKDASELSTILPESIEVKRADGSPYAAQGTTFRFNANEHITLEVSFGVGSSLSVSSVTVTAWDKGADIALDAKENYEGSIDVFAEPKSEAYQAAIIADKWVLTNTEVTDNQFSTLQAALTSLPNTRRISIEMPNCVTAVGIDAFYGCAALTSVSLPLSTSVGIDAFYGCAALTSVSLPLATTVGGNAFSGCAALTSVSLPLATAVGDAAFSGCASLTSVTLPLATTVGGNAFSGCASLTSVSLPLATTVGERAFYRCASLPSVSLPLATELGDRVFEGCGSLTSVTLPLATAVGFQAFIGCASLTSVTLPAATAVGTNAFYGCESLTALTFNTPITSWGARMFGDDGSIAKNITLTLAPAQMEMEAKGLVFVPTENKFFGGTDKTQFGTETYKAIVASTTTK